MGKIEEVIYENYKKAIIDGDYDQAKRATELGKILKAKIEAENFVELRHNSVNHPYPPLNRVTGKQDLIGLRAVKITEIIRNQAVCS